MLRRLLIPLSALLLLSGCTPSDPPPVIPSEKPTYQPIPPVTEQPTYTSTAGLPTTTASAEPSPTAFVTPSLEFTAPPGGETPEERAVRKGVEEYYTVFDTYLNNPNLNDFSDVERVTFPGGEERKVMVQLIKDFRDSGTYTTGVRSFRDFQVTFEQDDQALAVYCHDASATRIMEIGSPTPTYPPNPYLRETMYLQKSPDRVWRTVGVRAETEKC